MRLHSQQQEVADLELFASQRAASGRFTFDAETIDAVPRELATIRSGQTASMRRLLLSGSADASRHGGNSRIAACARLPAKVWGEPQRGGTDVRLRDYGRSSRRAFKLLLLLLGQRRRRRRLQLRLLLLILQLPSILALMQRIIALVQEILCRFQRCFIVRSSVRQQ
jgi:hypothetical protein